LDGLPLEDQQFNFFGAAVAALLGTRLRGADLYDAAGDIISVILSPTSKGPSPISTYVREYRRQEAEGKTPQTFDAFFQMAVYQKRNTILKKLAAKKRKKWLSIDRGPEEDEGGGMGAESLEDVRTLSAEDIYARKEILEMIPARLMADKRHGERYVAMWNLMKNDPHITLRELAQELNVEGVTSLSGGKWGTGSVDVVRTRILGMIHDFLKEKGIDWRSIFAGRKGFRFGLA
jgi:hypothetical protein